MKTNTRRKSLRRGYTLLEILAVVAIIMGLTGIFIVAIRSSLQKGRVANVVGTANAVSAAVTDFLQKSGSSGVIPLTEGNVPIYTTSSPVPNQTDSNPTTVNSAILDTVLLTEGALEKPLAVRMGPTQNQTQAGTAPLEWNIPKQRFEAGTGTADYTSTTRIECRLGGPLVAGNPFQVDGRTLMSNAYRVVYLVIPNVAIDDAYALALAANGAPMLSSDGTAGITSVELAASEGVTKGPVMFGPATDGMTDVYYYITKQ